MNPNPTLALGASATLRRRAGEREVRLFAEATGDLNPIHLDDEAAKRSRFGRRVVHGMWLGGLISAVLGTRLPGPGAIYLSQSLKFTAPVFVGETVSATVTVIKALERRGIYTLETVCTNERGETVCRGEARVLVEPQRS